VDKVRTEIETGICCCVKSNLYFPVSLTTQSTLFDLYFIWNFLPTYWKTRWTEPD